MNKLMLFLPLYMLFGAAVSAQTRPVKTGNTKSLPDYVSIKEGRLQAKSGYTVTISSDGKTFNVRNAKGVGGTFSCSCGTLSTGSCTATVNGGIILCSGSCTCTISVVISGVTYAVDVSAGVLRKI